MFGSSHCFWYFDVFLIIGLRPRLRLKKHFWRSLISYQGGHWFLNFWIILESFYYLEYRATFSAWITNQSWIIDFWQRITFRMQLYLSSFNPLIVWIALFVKKYFSFAQFLHNLVVMNINLPRLSYCNASRQNHLILRY